MPQLDEKEAREILRTIDRQNRRLTQLVADLLLLACMDNQPIAVSAARPYGGCANEEDRPQLCCLNDLVGDLVEELAAMAIASGVALTSDFRVQQQLNAVGDADRLYRLVANLIVNAIQYTPAGGKVTVILDCTHTDAIIQVQDTGIGIAAADVGRIFDRFYRVNSDRSRYILPKGLPEITDSVSLTW